MTFEHPYRLACIIVIALATGLRAYKEQQITNTVRRHFPYFRQSETQANASNFPRLKYMIWFFAWAMLVMSWARPQWGYEQRELPKSGHSIMILLDMSKSMLTEDISPSRIDRAKMIIQELLEKNPHDKFSLTLFSGGAETICPLTHDHEALKMFLSELDPNFHDGGTGTNLQRALEVSYESLIKAHVQDADLVLLSDGEDLVSSDIREIASKLNNIHARIQAVGLGTLKGNLIPIFRMDTKTREYIKDDSGQAVVSHLVEHTLQAAAQMTNGIYVRATDINNVVQTLQTKFRHTHQIESDSKIIKRIKKEQYFWFLIVGFVLLIVSRRLDRLELWR